MTNLEKELQTAIDRDTLVRISVELDALQQEEMIVEFNGLQIEV
jgi:hypothetical protein